MTVPEYAVAFGAGGGGGFFEGVPLRTDFPETWIWASFSGNDGLVVCFQIRLTVRFNVFRKSCSIAKQINMAVAG